ncbi:MAG TPA: Xaa-Pro peptidase family protein [Trueperaceae bacterium]|nr:Xaa-Pro peptidase family protein [Trueperaceae bacterium]
MNTAAEVQTRLEKLRQSVNRLDASALLVTTPANVRYLSRFSSPDDGAVLVTATGATLLTDARYKAQAAEEAVIDVDIVAGIDDAVLARLDGAHLAVEGENMTVARYRGLAKRLGYDPVVLDGAFSDLRVVKSASEIDALRRAAHVTDLAFAEALKMMAPGVTEMEVALCLESAMRRNGAEGASFTTIVASGPRGAMPHGVASQKPLASGELVTLDFGAVVDGYHADMTRTVAIGQVGAEERRLYEAVLEAQVASLAAVGPGITGREVDQVAREVLAKHGLEKNFTHSLGHGTGLVIHEEPRLSQKSDTLLRPGMIVTIEPGVYLPGFTGLRIEDLALVTADGHEVLSKSPKEFLAL